MRDSDNAACYSCMLFASFFFFLSAIVVDIVCEEFWGLVSPYFSCDRTDKTTAILIQLKVQPYGVCDDILHCQIIWGQQQLSPVTV